MGTFQGTPGELEHVTLINGFGQQLRKVRQDLCTFAETSVTGFRPPIQAVIDEIWVADGAVRLAVRDNGGTTYIIHNAQLRS